MTESELKLSRFSGPVSLGSEEDLDTVCDPCLTTSQQIEAQKYCLDCDEYLCKNCSDCHVKTKASRNHKLVDRDNIGKLTTSKDTELFTETCLEHTQEVIKYYCPRHEALCCHDCIIIHHRTCDIGYIPNKCANMSESEELNQTMLKMDQTLQELDGIIKSAKIRVKEIDNFHDTLRKDIATFRKEINDLLNQMQQKIENEADKKKTADKQVIQMILDSCDSLSSDIKTIQSSLQAKKVSRQNGQLYITMKQAQFILKSDEIKQAEDVLERKCMQYTFERNSSLEEMLSKQEVFGKLSLSPAQNTPRKKKTLHKLIHTEDINIRTKSDERDCFISGCAVLSSNKLVVADHNNKKLKIVNTHSKTVEEEESLGSAPFDVTVLPQEQIAVTMPDKREVRIITTDGQMSSVSAIPVNGRCRGVTYQRDHLYVVCVEPSCVLILDKQGNEQNKILLTSDHFSKPHYLVLSENSRLIYISDPDKHCVVIVTVHGEVSSVYKQKDLIGPLGMLMLDDGSVLVCSRRNGIIRHILGGLKQGQTSFDNLQYPYSICYNQYQNKVYIGSGWCNHLNVLSPQ